MSQPAVSQANAETRLAFPFNIRPLMAGWNLLFNRARRGRAPDPIAVRSLEPRALSRRRARPLRRLSYAAQCAGRRARRRLLSRRRRRRRLGRAGADASVGSARAVERGRALRLSAHRARRAIMARAAGPDGAGHRGAEEPAGGGYPRHGRLSRQLQRPAPPRRGGGARPRASSPATASAAHPATERAPRGSTRAPARPATRWGAARSLSDAQPLGLSTKLFAQTGRQFRARGARRRRGIRARRAPCPASATSWMTARSPISSATPAHALRRSSRRGTVSRRRSRACARRRDRGA